MRNYANFFIFLNLFITSISFAALPVYHYDPTIVELIGTLEIQTFPGAPNYESIKDGDEIEQGWYLRLQERIDVLANNPTTDLGWKTERNVKVLQMAVYASDDKEMPKKLKVGKTVKVKGKLYNMLTGHHHSRVLINVESVERVK